MANSPNGPNSLPSGIPSFAPAFATAVLTSVFMFLPWVNVPFAGMLEVVTGSGIVKSEYSVLDVYNLLSMVMGTEETPFEFTVSVYGFMALWAGSMALMLYGAFKCFSSGNGSALAGGGVCAAISAAIWFLVVRQLSSEIAGETSVQAFTMTTWPFATVAAGIATAILAPKSSGGAVQTARVQQAPRPAPSVPRTPTPTAAPPTRPATPTPTPTAPAPAPAPTPVPDLQSVQSVRTTCYCPTCGYTIQVTVPNASCMVNITCGHCGTKFPMEVRPRS